MQERETPVLPPGTEFHGMVVEEWVSTGGYGTVYRARDKRTGTLFALKFIPLYRADEWSKRELSIAMPLQHDNLVQLVGAGYWPFNLPEFFWLKMVYVEGRQLDVWAWEENPDARAVVGTVMGVARGLSVVHAGQVVHRDIKEANILVRDRDGEAVLVDFGAAWREGQATLTQGLFPPGTPHYRSPEAWRFGMEHERTRGAHYRPGKADDLYALGVVLYRLLTGRYPFVVTEDKASVRAVVEQAPLPPHLANPRVPEALSQVCLQLLEKKPEARPESAVALYEVLKQLKARADKSWEVALREGPEAPRRGRRAAAKKRPQAVAAPAAPVAPQSTTTTAPALVAHWPWQAFALHALARAALGLAVLVGLVLGGVWLAERWKSQRPPGASSATVPQSPASAVQEVAPPWKPLEAEQAAAPPPAEDTPAAVASRAAPPKDMPPVKKPQKTPNPQVRPPPRGLRSALASWCVGAAALSTACTGAPVRPATLPPAEDCPPGAAKAMKDLGWFVGGGEHTALFQPVSENPRRWTVREGPASVNVPGDWGKLPDSSTLHGRLYFGEGRVYGRFTQARTPQGDVYPVCLELYHLSERGYEVLGREGPDAVRIFSSVDVKVVPHFK